MKVTRAVAIAAVVVGAALGGASPAWATVTWQDPPTDVSAPVADVYSGSPQLASAADGSIMAVWAAYGPSTTDVMARLWVDGEWSATSSSVSGPLADLGDFAVVARADGSYVVVWNSPEGAVQSSVFTSGTWSAPVALTVPAVEDELGEFALAAAPDGTVIAGWVRDDFVDVAVLGDAGWSATQELGEGDDVSVAVLPSNVFAVAWRSQVIGATGPSVRTYAAGAWSTTTLLSETDGFSPNLIAGPNGFVSMWMEGNDRLPWASTYTGGSWSAKVALRESNQIGGGLTAPGPIASTPNGSVVTWLDGEFNNGPMVWARVFSGSAWAAPLEVIPSTQQAVDVQLVGRPDGSYVIAWQSNGGGPVMARTFTASAVGTPVELAPVTVSPNGFRLTAASNGYVVATWQQQGSVVARVFDGEQWGAETAVLGEGYSQAAVATSDNVFMVAWEWYDNTSGLVRASTYASPEGAGGGGDTGGEELAATGAAPIATVASALAIVLLAAGGLLVVRRRQHA
jgi:hypothetical protein